MLFPLSSWPCPRKSAKVMLFYSHVPFALPSLWPVLPFALKAIAAIVPHLNALSTLFKSSVLVKICHCTVIIKCHSLTEKKKDPGSQAKVEI